MCGYRISSLERTGGRSHNRVPGEQLLAGKWIKHPAHCNLYGLPRDLIDDIIRDFATTLEKLQREITNYEEWLFASYGEKFARTFPMEYTEKYHTTTARNMSTDWLGPRMYRPTLDEVFRGSLSPATPNVH